MDGSAIYLALSSFAGFDEIGRKSTIRCAVNVRVAGNHFSLAYSIPAALDTCASGKADGIIHSRVLIYQDL